MSDEAPVSEGELASMGVVPEEMRIPTDREQSKNGQENKPSQEIPDHKKEEARLYQGNTNKMEVFNQGEKGQDRAVEFQLKMGEQENSFALAIDPKNPERVINLPDSRAINEMTSSELRTVVFFQKQGDKLLMEREHQDAKLSEQEIRENHPSFPIDKNLGVELTDFDAAKNSITIHKVVLESGVSTQGVVPGARAHPEAPRPVPNIEPKPPAKEASSWKRRLITLLGPTIVAIPTLLIPGDSDVAEQPPSPPVTAEIPKDLHTEGPTLITPTEKETPINAEFDQSLQCEKTQEYEIKEGDYLTKALVDVNGANRYLGGDGKMDVNKLYQDLMCLLVIPDNLEELGGSDPTVASFVEERRSKAANTPESVTATSLYEGIRELNSPDGKERYQGANSQLVMVQPGQAFKIPDFR